MGKNFYIINFVSFLPQAVSFFMFSVNLKEDRSQFISMGGHKLQNVHFHHNKIKRNFDMSASFPDLHPKQAGLSQFYPHTMEKRAADTSGSEPTNSTNQRIFSFHLKKDECVEV
jgi:hypothetical protein